MSFLYLFLGIVIGILVAAVAVFLTLLGYLRQMRKDRKDRIIPLNVKYLLISFVVVLVIHFVCIAWSFENYNANLGSDDNAIYIDFWSGLGIGIKEIYNQLGGLTFEGQNFLEAEDVCGGILSAIYFFSILYLALLETALIILGVSYQFYSRVRLLRYKKYNSIYIFTNATEESLTLAKTIDDGQELDDLNHDTNQKYKVEVEKIRRKFASLLDKNKREFYGIENELIHIGESDEEKKKALVEKKEKNLSERDSLLSKMNGELFLEKLKRKLTKTKNSEEVKVWNDDSLIIFAGDEIGKYDKDNVIHHHIFEKNYLYISLNKIKDKKSVIQRLFGNGLSGTKLLDFLGHHNISIISLATDTKGKAIESKNSDFVFDDIECALKSLSIEFNGSGLTHEEIDKECLCSPFKIKTLNYYVLSGSEINFEFYEEKLLDCFKKAFKFNENQNVELKNLPPIINLNVLSEAIMSAEDMIAKRHSAIAESDNLIFGDSSGQKKWLNYKENGTKALVIGFGLNGQKALDHLYADSVGGYLDDKYMFIPNKFSAEVIDRAMDNVISSYIVSHPSYAFISGKYRDYVSVNDDCYKKLRGIYSKFDNFDEINSLMAFPQIFYREGNYNNNDFLKVIEAICNRNYDSVIIALGDDEKTIECANAVLKSIRQTAGGNVSNKNNNLEIFINIRDKDNNHRLMWTKTDNDIFKNINVIYFGNTESIYSHSAMMNYSSAANIHKTYLETQGEDVFDNNSASRSECRYIKDCSLFERKTNMASSGFGRMYDAFLDKSGQMDKIREDCLSFENERNEAYKNKSYHVDEQSIPSKKQILFKKYDFDDLFFTNLLNPKKGTKIDENLKVLNATLANHEKMLAFEKGKEKYLSKESVGYLWRYLIQLEHQRWARHAMMYGRAYLEKYQSFTDSNLEANKTEKNYWKNRLLLHIDLLPYSSFTDYREPSTPKYLSYATEDYDYSSVMASINMDRGISDDDLL